MSTVGNYFAFNEIDWQRVKSVTLVEKERLLEDVIRPLMELHLKHRSELLVALEDALEKTTDDFLRLGIVILLEGGEANNLFGILKTTLNASILSDYEYLANILKIEALFCMSVGHPMRNTYYFLNSYFGAGFARKSIELYKNNAKTIEKISREELTDITYTTESNAIICVVSGVVQ